MPKIIPIKELKNTSRVSLMVHESDEPVFVTKNGYSDMVMMSSEVYDRAMYALHVYAGLAEGELAISEGRVKDAFEALDALDEKYGV
jgi:PHD/YefM family antitoxin component YafN of YafNO toxin-antitoxin module